MEIIKMQDLSSDNLLIYDNKSSKNILFLGSCRMFPLMYYFNKIHVDNLHRNMYFIYVSHWLNKQLNIDTILMNTDIIICETMKNFGVLNTVGEKNFFNIFPIRENTKIFKIPNLQLRMYAHDSINRFHIEFDHNKLYHYFLESRQRLKQNLIKHGYEELDLFIDRHIHDMKLFSTYDHPMPILSVLLFKYLALKMNIVLENEFLNKLLSYVFLQGNDTPLYDIDRDLYRLTFIDEIEKNYDNLYTIFYKNYKNKKSII